MEFHVIVVNYNSDRYVQSLYDSLIATSSTPFIYNICDNGSTDDSKAFLRDFQSKHPSVRLFWRQQTNDLPSSQHHAAAVDLIMSNISDGYCLVIDVDCYMFARNWQKMFIDMLHKSGKDCISTGKKLNMHGRNVMRGIPYMTFLRSHTINSRGISFMPDIPKTLAGVKGYDFGYRLNEECSMMLIDMVIPAPTLAGLPKALVQKSMDFVYDGFLIAQHMKMGGRGFKAEFYDIWLERCRSVDKKLRKQGHEYVSS